MAVVASIYLFSLAGAATSPYDIDVNELDQKSPPPAKKSPPSQKPKPKPKKAPKPILYSDGYAKYTVQEGDYRVRILAKHLHLPEAEVQRLLPEILRLNGISGLSELEIGQTLIVPMPQKAAPAGEAAPPQQGEVPAGTEPVAPPPGGDSEGTRRP